MSKKINKFNFHLFIQVSMGEKQFLPLKLNKQMKIESIDLFAHLVELEVLKYLPSFPHWQSRSYYKDYNWTHNWQGGTGLLELTVHIA